MEVAPGAILHSSQVDPALVQACLNQMGMNGEQNAITSQAFFQILNFLATTVALPTPPSPAAAAQRPQPPDLGPVVVEVEDGDQREEPEVMPMDDEEAEWTDGSTDVEASELKAANDNANLSPTKIKKKKKRGGGKGNQGKGSAADSSKSSVTTKLTKKA